MHHGGMDRRGFWIPARARSTRLAGMTKEEKPLAQCKAGPSGRMTEEKATTGVETARLEWQENKMFSLRSLRLCALCVM